MFFLPLLFVIIRPSWTFTFDRKPWIRSRSSSSNNLNEESYNVRIGGKQRHEHTTSTTNNVFRRRKKKKKNPIVVLNNQQYDYDGNDLKQQQQQQQQFESNESNNFGSNIIVPIIPRHLLFGSVKHRLPKMSPDGKYLAYLGEDSNSGGCYLYLQSMYGLEQRLLYKSLDDYNYDANHQDQDDYDEYDSNSDNLSYSIAPLKLGDGENSIIRSFFWAEDSRTILYYVNSSSKPGDESYHLWSLNVLDGVKLYLDLTPGENVKVQSVSMSSRKTNEIMIATNARNSSLFDMYRVNIYNGKSVLDTWNNGNVIAWGVDSYTFQVQQAMTRNDEHDCSTTIWHRDVYNHYEGQEQFGEWKELYHYPYGDLGNFIAFGKDKKTCWLTSSCGRDTKALVKLDMETNTTTTICDDEECDIGEIQLDPRTDQMSMVSFNYKQRELQIFDPVLKHHYHNLLEQGPEGLRLGDIYVVGQSRDQNQWIVSYEPSDAPPIYGLYNTLHQTVYTLFCSQPKLLNYQFSPMEAISITVRDGLPLVAYLTRPLQTQQQQQQQKEEAATITTTTIPPFILLVHGGPWEERDYYGFNPTVQWLSNRGYTVLQVNFRGGSGYGKSFSQKGDGQWGIGTMQHDLTDSIQYCIDNHIADANNIAIFGSSYGGYAALSGLAFTPELYKCGVVLAAPSNVKSMIDSIPTYWGPLRNTMLKRVGPVDVDEDFNKRISPFYHLENIRAPLFVGQGANDVRVLQEDTDRMVSILRENDNNNNDQTTVEYVVYPEEGHTIMKPSNREDLFERIELFLNKHMMMSP